MNIIIWLCINHPEFRGTVPMEHIRAHAGAPNTRIGLVPTCDLCRISSNPFRAAAGQPDTRDAAELEATFPETGMHLYVETQEDAELLDQLVTAGVLNASPKSIIVGPPPPLPQPVVAELPRPLTEEDMALLAQAQAVIKQASRASSDLLFQVGTAGNGLQATTEGATISPPSALAP